MKVKSLFAVVHEIGLDSACEKIGIEKEGTPHRDDNDAWNIAGVLCILGDSRRQTH